MGRVAARLPRCPEVPPLAMLRQLEESPALRVVVASLCAYEAVAITTRACPTITALHRRHPVVGVTIVAALAWHFLPVKES